MPGRSTGDARPARPSARLPVWWKLLLDCFVILMVYDFFYYLVHRFLFHDGGFSFTGVTQAVIEQMEK